MRKKDYKLRHKIKYCIVNCHDKFDRYFVKEKWGDSQFVPFSKTSYDDPYDETDYNYLSQKKIRKYLKRWFLKRINHTVEKVYSEYVKLGWCNEFEKKIIWDKIVKNGIHETTKYYWKFYDGLYVDLDNILRHKKRGLPN
jgi:hypothetical protein